MAFPDSISDRERRSYRIDPLDADLTRQAAEVIFDPSALPIPVSISSSASGTVINAYGEAPAVASLDTIIVATYVVPASKKFFLQFIEVSGTNYAKFTIKKNSIAIGTIRTWWMNFNGKIDFIDAANQGLELPATTVIDVEVFNDRPSSADFEARILGVLDDA